MRRHALPLVYLAFILPVLATLAVLTPPWQAPDEPLHMARAVQIAHGGFVAHRLWATAGGLSDPAIYESFKPVAKSAMHAGAGLTPADLAAARAVRWSSAPTPTAFPNTAQYPPTFYLPAAAAYWLGRAGGLGIADTLTLARLLNAALFAAITAAALATARGARPLLAAILLLPTTLFLAASASQDSLLFAFAALAAALADRAAADPASLTPGRFALLSAVLACACAARPPYLPLACLPLAIAPAALRRPAFLAAAAAAGVTLAWSALTILHVSVPLGGAQPHAQLAFIAAHPARILIEPTVTVATHALRWWREMIGVLGWTDTPLPPAIIALETGTLILAALASGTILPAPRRRLWAASLAATFLAILAVQWIFWTWPGQEEITGVLGRYFIPLALMAALLIPPHRRRLPPAAIWSAIAACAVLSAAVTVQTLTVRYNP